MADCSEFVLAVRQSALRAARSTFPAPVYSGCNTGCGGWAHERLPDPVQQYYYVNQGPTYTGPGNFAPYPTYQEGGVRGLSPPLVSLRL